MMSRKKYVVELSREEREQLEGLISKGKSSAWLKQRNERHVKADWRFTTDDARIKLKNLYPVL